MKTNSFGQQWPISHPVLPPGTDGRTFHSFTFRIARERTLMYTALTHVPNQ
jgi:hypothetical protein